MFICLSMWAISSPAAFSALAMMLQLQAWMMVLFSSSALVAIGFIMLSISLLSFILMFIILFIILFWGFGLFSKPLKIGVYFLNCEALTFTAGI